MTINQQNMDGDCQRQKVDRQLAGAHSAIRKVVVGILDDLAPLMTEMFANVDDYFFSRAERAEDSNHHHVFFDAMRKIRSRREDICREFYDGIIEAAAGCWAATGSSRPDSREQTRHHRFDAGTMSVLTEEEMELSVAVSGIVQKGKSRYGRELGSVVETLHGISRQARSERPECPVATASVVQSFVRAVQSLSLELPVMLALLKLFERHVADHLGAIYAAVLARLERDGIRIVEAAASRTPVTAKPQRADAAGADEWRSGEMSGRTSDAPQSGVRGVVAFSELQSLLGSRPESPGGRPVAGHGADHSAGHGAGQVVRESVPVDELIDTVSSVQHRYLEQVGGFEGSGRAYPSLQSFLLSLPVEKGGFRDAEPDQQDTLKLVSALFEHMFRNENLSVASKALIARMQFPVLKIALVDRSLFSDADHPARQLLNRVAIDGVGWPPSEALLKRNPLYLAAEDIVARLNDKPKPNVEIFAELVQEWTELVSRHQRRTRTAVRRLNETALGKAKLEAAKRIVQTTVNERAAGARLPAAVSSFISTDWTQAMVVACVKHGTDAGTWGELCSVLEDLVLASDPSRLNGAGVTPGFSDLISRLHDGLERHGSSEAAAAEALKPIAATLERLVAEAQSGLSTDGYEVEDLEIMEEIHLTDVDDLVDPEEGPEDYRLTSLEQGTWVEIRADDLDRPLRCQLAVAVDDTQTYVFNDDKGMKVREMSRKSLLQGLVSGSISIIREEMLVERAIEDLLASLKTYSPIGTDSGMGT